MCMAAVVALAGVVDVQDASAQSPWWHLTSNVRPSNLRPGGTGTIVLQASNVGDLPTSGVGGNPIVITDTLPAGVTVLKVSPNGKPEPEVSFNTYAASKALGTFEEGRFHGPGFGPEEGHASLHACSEPAPGKVRCTYPGGSPALNPYEFLEMGIAVKAEVGPAVAGGESEAEVTGGEAPAAQIERPILVSEAAPSFGVEDLSFVPEAEGGEVDAQAGSHPFQLTATFALNQTADPLAPAALPRDLRFSLPPGLVQDAAAVQQCSELDFKSLRTGGSDLCPEDTAIGVVTITVDEPGAGGVQTLSVPLFNLIPGHGEPARFGVDVLRAPVNLDTGVRSGADYGVSIGMNNLTELQNFMTGTITFWGVPGASNHEASRGWGCLAGGHWASAAGLSCIPSSESQPRPLLTLPTSCASPFVVALEGESWPLKVGPGIEELQSVQLPRAEYSLEDGFGRPLGITGCNQLPFEPSIGASPDVQNASTPSGLTVNIKVPQEVNANAGGLASSAIRDITIALPAGVTLNPAGAGGLEACSESQVGYVPDQSEPPGKLTFTPSTPEPLEPGPNLGRLGFCPNASKIATVKLQTPILAHPIEGFLYLATQNANPFGSLLAVYIVVEDPVSGTLVKLAGELSLNQQTGQITATFAGTPQIPIEDLELKFFSGERALLATPAHCGTYPTNASFAPWSGEEPIASTSSFEITSGPNGGAGTSGCPSNPLPFAPSLTAGTTNLNAGAFSPLTATIGREDGQQPLQSLRLRLPAGLSAMLAGVPLCPEQQANEGTCTSASEIGQTSVAAGLGGDPYTIAGGKVYLTGPYSAAGPCTPGGEGTLPGGTPLSSSGCAPFGLSIVTPVKAGPLDLEDAPENRPGCDCLVIRAKIEVDPQTAQLTIVTAGIPSIIDGVPLQIKDLNITIDRSGFIFNPSSCDPMSIEGAITGGEGAQIPTSSSFQVANCKNLNFTPKLTALTRANGELQGHGASLHIVVAPGASSSSSSSASAPTAQANIRSLKLDLPQPLPARLETIQKACPESTFDANPAKCPKASVVGSASVQTPILATKMAGPAYLVSKNGTGATHPGESKIEKEEAAFPNLVLVLQGEGVRIDLSGALFVSAKNITSVTFRTIPDVPIRRLDLILPEAKTSILAASAGLCTKRALSMTTAITAQNGARLKPTVEVAVEGCKHKKAKRPKKKPRANKHPKK